MNTTDQQQQGESTESISPDVENTPVEVNIEPAGTLAALPPANGTTNTTEEWKEWGQQVKQILAELPDYIGQFFSDNQRAIISLGLLFGGIVSLKLILAVLDAVNDIPLLAPTFELVGVGYTTWFVYRYLLQASTRQELSEEIKNFKGQVLGQDSQIS
ncbi:MAG: CAAD domain-containing protein [Aphanothece sp. CMT-3BRIN-NPC111]|jgi:hypothetical protein|nr:CAAD domain-containing protein [Aphanothece sp. CMT-3BRIN-NPC111]